MYRGEQERGGRERDSTAVAATQHCESATAERTRKEKERLDWSLEREREKGERERDGIITNRPHTNLEGNEIGIELINIMRISPWRLFPLPSVREMASPFWLSFLIVK